MLSWIVLSSFIDFLICLELIETKLKTILTSLFLFVFALLGSIFQTSVNELFAIREAFLVYICNFIVR